MILGGSHQVQTVYVTLKSKLASITGSLPKGQCKTSVLNFVLLPLHLYLHEMHLHFR